MRVTGLREVSFASESIEVASVGLAAITGHPGFEIQEQPAPPVSARFRSFPVGDRSIALMDSLGENTAISRFLERRGPGGFSVTFEVDDVEEYAAHLRGQGARLILDQPMQLEGRTGAEAFDSIRINFVSPSGPAHRLVFELQELRGGQAAPVSGAETGPGVPTAINEVHCAVTDVDAASSDLARLFGFEVGPLVSQPEPPEQVRYRNLYLDGRPVLALIGPEGEGSTVQRFLDRRGPGVFAVSLRVADGAAFQNRVEAAGLKLLFPEPKQVHGARIGPWLFDDLSIRWVRPVPQTAKGLFEVQQFEMPR
jgi:methylmalonyl-CoA/ethylmalonyl-CoA epimerase